MTVFGMHHSDSTEVAAPAAELYELVASLEHMGRWSPQNESVTWAEDATGVVGDRFTGHNHQNGRDWEVPCQVSAAEPGRRFEWVTRPEHGGCVRWTWEFEEADEVTTVTETWDVQRLPPAIEGRTPEQYAEITAATIEGIAQTLTNLKSHVERS